MQRDLIATYRADAAIADAFSKDAELFSAALAITGDVHVLASIYRSKHLFKAIHNAYSKAGQSYRVYTDPDGALFSASPSMRDGPDAVDDTVFYISDMGLYFRVDGGDHRTLLDALINHRTRSVALGADDTGEVPLMPINLYQLVLSNRKQKLVFVFTRADLCEKLKYHALQCFGQGTTIETSGDHVRIGIEGTTDDELLAQYNRLYTFIRNADDRDCYTAMQSMPAVGRQPYLYRAIRCDDIADTDPKGVAEYLERIHGVAHVTIINIHGGVHGGVGVVINNAAPAAAPRDVCRRWIEANPPAVREAAGAYYKRYKASLGTAAGISIQAFTAEVKEHGHTHRSGKTGNYWIPPAGDNH